MGRRGQVHLVRGPSDPALAPAPVHGVDLGPVAAVRLEVVDVVAARLERDVDDPKPLPLAALAADEDPQLRPRVVEPLEGRGQARVPVVPVEEEGVRVAGEPHEDVVAVAPGQVSEPLVVGRPGLLRGSARGVLRLVGLGHRVRRLADRLLAAHPSDEVPLRIEALPRRGGRGPPWRCPSRPGPSPSRRPSGAARRAARLPVRRRASACGPRPSPAPWPARRTASRPGAASPCEELWPSARAAPSPAAASRLRVPSWDGTGASAWTSWDPW